MTTFGERLELLTPKQIPLTVPPKDLAHLPIDNTFIGVELEIENVNIQRINEAVDLDWLAKSFIFERDTSLRNNGLEIITRTGTTFNGALYNIYHLYEVMKKLHKQYGNFTISPRCSVHVHWNMLDKTEEQLKTVLLLYLAIEKAMFAVSGKRVNNIFCVPTLSNIPFSLTKRLLDPKEFLAIKLGRRGALNVNWGKYSALNLLPLVTQGTIEFRHHKGTLDYKEILNWLITIQNLHNFAARFTSPAALFDWLTNVVKTNAYNQLLPIFVQTGTDLVSRPVVYDSELLNYIKESTNKTVALCSCGTDINPDDFLAESPKGPKASVKKAAAVPNDVDFANWHRELEERTALTRAQEADRVRAELRVRRAELEREAQQGMARLAGIDPAGRARPEGLGNGGNLRIVLDDIVIDAHPARAANRLRRR